MVSLYGPKLFHLEEKDIAAASTEICTLLTLCGHEKDEASPSSVDIKARAVNLNLQNIISMLSEKQSAPEKEVVHCEPGSYFDEDRRVCLDCIQQQNCTISLETCVNSDSHKNLLQCDTCINNYEIDMKYVCVSSFLPYPHHKRRPLNIDRDPLYTESKKYINWTEVDREYLLTGDKEKDRATIEKVVDLLMYRHEKKYFGYCRLDATETKANEGDWEKKPLLYGRCKENPTEECFQMARNLMNYKCSLDNYLTNNSPRGCYKSRDTYEGYNYTSGVVTGNYCVFTARRQDELKSYLSDTLPVRTPEDKISFKDMVKCKACEAAYISWYQPIQLFCMSIPDAVLQKVMAMHSGLSFVALFSPAYILAMVMTQFKYALPFGEVPLLASSLCSQQYNANSDILPNCVYDAQNHFNSGDDPFNDITKVHVN